jgi:LacI family transcriptional regulator
MSRSKMQRRREKSIPPASGSAHIPHVLLLIDTSGAVGRGIIEGIGRYALENGPWSIQFEYRTLDSLPPHWLKQWQGDGIISRTVNIKQGKILQETKLPLVELHGHPKFRTSQVLGDVSVAGQIVFDHFFNCGFRQFAFFTYGNAWWIKKHREGYCKVVERQGYDCHIYQPPASKRSMPVWHDSQRPGLIKWLLSLPRPIGIFTIGDLHAVRLLDMCRELNIAVPEEIAILGAGNDPVICETVRPTLSSLDLNARRFGYEAAGLLDRMMAGKSSLNPIHVSPSHVVVRQSTDTMVIEDADVAQAMRFIREFACKGIDVSDVADKVGLSRRALERRFHRYLGRAPKAEIMRIRIERAKTLLSLTDKTSQSITHQCSFPSPVYFTKAFRREVGMTPKAYRRMRRISRDPGEAAK